MSRKGKSTDKRRPKQHAAPNEEAPRPKKAAKATKPPKYKHAQYWLSEEVNLQ